MKHKILFSILSILGIASIFGLTLLPKEEANMDTPQRLSLSSTTSTQSIVTKEDIPLHDWIKTAQVGNTLSFNHFVYTREAAKVSVTCTEPEAVETLYLYFNLQRNDTAFIPVSHYNIDFSQLINVKKVVIFNNDPFYCFGTDLKKLPNPFDLYINGYFNSLEEYPNIKELYICEVYDTDTSDIDSYSDSHKLASTHITKVHYANWNQTWTSANRFSNEEIENADGVLVQVDFLPEETIGFSEALFYPHDNYISQKKLLGATAYPYYKGRLTKIFPEDIEYKIDKISSQVKTFILPSDINFTNYGTFNVDTLVIDNANFNFTSLLNSTIDTLVFRNHTEDFSFNQIIKAKNIWFAPLETPPTITSSSYNESNNAQIEHIYIPNEYKEAYDKFSSEFFQSRITYYDVADLEEYHTSFESTNGNIYYVEDDTKDIDTLESYIVEMSEGGFTFTTTEALDTQYQIFLQNKTEEPDEPTPSTPTDFVDESEFINGYQALGSIYYTSSKSLEDILKIASNYILQKDGKRCDEEKEVIFLVNGNTLNTTIKVNGKIVASVSSNLHKLDTKEFGEYIYLQNVGAFSGELLYDTTSSTTKTPQEIYAYLLHQITTTKEVATPDFKDFSLTSPSSVDISSYLTHTNGNQYKVQMECLSFDLSQAKDLSNPEITFQQFMSPDDDKEDPESEYAVKTITKIYLPNTLNARGVPSSINRSILTYKGTPYTEKECIHTITSSNKNDGKDYTITMAGSLPDSIWYEHTVPVTILRDTYNVAFAVCEDNTIIVILPYSKKLSKEILSSNLEDFITKELKITESNLKLVEEMDLNLTKTFTGSTYKNGSIEIVVSGLSTLLNSSLTTPVDQSKEKEGFTALTHFIFSNDISVERAAKLVADKILYFNGYPVDTPYKTNITLYPNSIGFEFIKEDKVVLRITSTYKVIKNAPYSFVSASSSYHTGIILTSPKDVMVTTFMNEVMPYIETTFEADYSSTVSLATKGNTKLEGIYKLADSNYYEYTYTIMALDIEAKENQVDVEIIYKDKVEEDKKDKPIDDIFNDFKDNFENNTAFKTMSILLGTILGLGLIYVIYLIIHKIHKWLKK